MALTNFQRISFDEANPALMGALRESQLQQSDVQRQKTMLANQLAQLQMPLASQMQMANIAYKQNKAIHDLNIANVYWQAQHPGQKSPYEDLINAQVQRGNSSPIPSQNNNGSIYQEPNNNYSAASQQPGSPGLNLPVPAGGSNVQPLNPKQQELAKKIFDKNQPTSSSATSSDEDDWGPVDPRITYGHRALPPTQAEVSGGLIHSAATNQYYKNESDIAQQPILDEIKSFDKAREEATNAALPARAEMQNILPIKNLFDKLGPTYFGPGFGKLDPNSWLAAVRNKFDPEQFSNLQTGLGLLKESQPMNLSIVKSMIGAGSRVNMTEAKAAQQLNVQPTDTMQARYAKANNRYALLERADELATFWDDRNKYRNNVGSYDKGTADEVISNFQKKRPLLDENGNFLPYNAGQLKLFSSPEAFKAVHDHGSWEPTKAEQSAYDKKYNLSKAMNAQSKLLLKNAPAQAAQAAPSYVGKSGRKIIIVNGKPVYAK